jgi:hypothetical protein
MPGDLCRCSVFLTTNLAFGSTESWHSGNNCQAAPVLAETTKAPFCLVSASTEQTVPQICWLLESPLEGGSTPVPKCDWENNWSIWCVFCWSPKSLNSYILGVILLPMITCVKGYLKQLLSWLSHFKVRLGSQVFSACQIWWDFLYSFSTSSLRIFF